MLCFSIIGVLLLKEELFWGINKTCKYIAFFWIGALIKNVDFRKNKFCFSSSIGLFIALVLLFNGCSLPSALDVYMLGTMGCISVLLLSASMEKNTKYLSAILSGLGKITMGVLVMHGLLYRILIVLCSKILHISVENIRGSLGISFALSIITILLLIWPISLINEYIPVLLGRRGKN